MKPALVAQTLLPASLKMAARSTLPVPTRLLGVSQGCSVGGGEESLGRVGSTWCQRMLCMRVVSWVGFFAFSFGLGGR